ncbi:ABC transporter ATP-binding protein [Clostridium sp. SYSU_GA19001]|uniref:ABC transporter ATP-binding protein n=1 Tax=Clostridium caldaquaticum TaxID=2940653 RepID=UPI0020771B2B|nr:ABC transporter ATP-binding protein [Clostridium caldaquaticum]MCM8709801.1 ABC transporter ATP-binding protein [Clostridium caldaquaticum]
MLKVNELSIQFGGLKAVDNFDLFIGEKEVVGLIGPNGAGKTTVFNMLTGVYAPTNGSINYKGDDIHGLKPYVITQKKIARTFQNIRLFSNLTILDNIKISYGFKAQYNIFSAIFRTPKFRKEEQKIEKEAMELLKLFNLDSKADELASNLSYGEQRRLEIARALATKPDLLLLDEPAAGMNPQETMELMNHIRWIRDKFNLSVLLIEHDMKLVMGVCERIAVLDYGKKIAEGTPEQIKKDKRVIAAYLGGSNGGELLNA